MPRAKKVVEDQEVSEEAPKRRRGRPAKAAAEAPTPRRRGRPAKAAAAAEETEAPTPRRNGNGNGVAFDSDATVTIVGEVPGRGKTGPIVDEFLAGRKRKKTTVEMVLGHIEDEFECSHASAGRKLQRLVDNGFLSVEG